MTLLTIAKNIAVEVSIEVPTQVKSNDQSPDARKIVKFTQDAGDEIARRGDWTALRKTFVVVGTGASVDYALPTDFARLTMGLAVRFGALPIRVGMSADEWNSLTPVLGVPRYARLLNGKISFYPFPDVAVEITVSYISKSWCTGGATWSADDDTPLFPEKLIEQGAIWRWRRQLGQDFQDHMAEFEASMAEYAKADDGVRMP